MDIQKTMQQAMALYEEGKYLEATTLANKLADEPDPPFRELFLLNAKCLIRVTPSLDDVNSTAISNTLVDAIADVTEVSELYDILYDFNCAYEAWRRERLIHDLAMLSIDPSLDNYKVYIGLAVKYLMTSLTIDMGVKQSDKYKNLVAEAGLTPKEATEKYQRTPENDVTNEMIKEAEYDTGCIIFDDAKSKLASASQTKESAMAILNSLYTAELLVKGAAGEKVNIDKFVRLERLHKCVEIVRYRATATVSVNGQTVYIAVNLDNENQALQKMYAQIKLLDPSFVIPALPTRAAQTSGGCYVATAVYGSYNCPQVWTLRRYRDNTLAKTWYGRAFVRLYYAVSPTLVKWFGQSSWFKKLWKPSLDRMVSSLQEKGVESTPYNDRTW